MKKMYLIFPFLVKGYQCTFHEYKIFKVTHLIDMVTG